MKPRRFLFLLASVMLLLWGAYFFTLPADSMGLWLPPALLTITAFYLAVTKKKPTDSTPFLDILLKSYYFRFLFVPGGDLLSPEVDRALDRDNNRDVSKCVFFLLIFMLIGGNLLTVNEVVPHISNIDTDWFKKDNASQWPVMYFATFLSLLGFTVFLNMMVWIAIRQGYHVDIVEKLEAISVYFQLSEKKDNGSPSKADGRDERTFWDLLSSRLNHVYGHKTWGGKKMHDLLTLLQSQKDMGTSRWFLLQFAADALDDHVKDENQSLTFTYTNEAAYSKFLADTMGYCSRGMIWIVDRDDFLDVLLPKLVRETILSLASELAMNPADSSSDTGRNRKVVEALNDLKNQCLKPSADIYPHCQTFCDFFCDANGTYKCNGVARDPSLCQYNSNWDSVLDAYVEHWAIPFLNGLNVDLSSIAQERISHWCDIRQSDRCFHPHLRRFYEHPTDKARIIEIPNIPRWENLDISERSSEVLNKICAIKGITIEDFPEKMIPEKAKWSKLDSKKALKILIFSLRLFEHFSNSNTRHKLLGFGMVDSKLKHLGNGLLERPKRNGASSNRASYDLGIYDSSVMVNSTKEGDGRKVKWTILSDPKEHPLAVFKPPENNDNREGEEEKKKGNQDVLALSDFISFLEQNYKP